MSASLMTVREAAVELRVDPETVRRWVRAGKLDALRAGPGPKARIRIDVDAIAALMTRRTK